MPYPYWDPNLGRMVHPWEKLWQGESVAAWRNPSVDPAGPWPPPDLYPRRPRDMIPWLVRRGEPPRFWDEEYYTDDPGPWPPPDELGDDTARGYRFFLTHPLSETRESRLINAIKGGTRL